MGKTFAGRGAPANPSDTADLGAATNRDAAAGPGAAADPRATALPSATAGPAANRRAPQALAAALDLHQKGRIRQAEKIYHRILAQDPNHADALHLLGLAAFQNDEPEKAVDLIRRAIRENSTDPVYYDNLGKILQNRAHYAEAAECFEQVVKYRPGDLNAYVNLGNNYYRAGQETRSVEPYRRALELQPDCVEACANLGTVLCKHGQHVEATALLRQARKLQDDNPEVLLNLGVALLEQGEEKEAGEVLDQVLRLRPDFAEGHYHLGLLRRSQLRLEEAAACCREALRLRPAHAESASLRGVVLLEQGRVEEAAAAFREALRLKPQLAVAHSNLIFCLNYDSRQDPAALLEEHRRWEEHGAAMAAARRPHANDPSPGRRLRIGYVSPDFRTHPVTFFFGPILATHNREHFACYCYSSTGRPDALTERLRSLADAWRNVRGASDEELADLIRQDQIDILVDLAGHTADSRLRVFAAKPAPVQVTYLGYPNTTGLAAVDYRITDAWADPPGEADRLHTEELVRLPAGFLCYQPVTDAPDVGELPCLKTGVFTFGSFNNVSKMSLDVVAAWSAILKAATRSGGSARLLLKAKALRDETTREWLLQRFAASGIPRAQVELVPPAANLGSHLEVYKQVDLALDTFPYNGTTTTCDAMWMGVPVITLAGRTHASRVGVSLLSRTGLTEFIADSVEAYIDLAVRTSQNPERLRQIRVGMRARVAQSPLTDASTLTRDLETAYRQMWRRWCDRHTAPAPGTSRLTPDQPRSIPQPPTPNPEPLRAAQPPPSGPQHPRLASDPAASDPGPLRAASQPSSPSPQCPRPASDPATSEPGPLRAASQPSPPSPQCPPPAFDPASSGPGHPCAASQPSPPSPQCPRPASDPASSNPEPPGAAQPLPSGPQTPRSASHQPPSGARPPRPAPSDAATLQQRVASFPYWYHRIELPGGVVTPGWAPLNKDAYRLPADLTGKRVLDVGAWDGFWTFEAIRRGARQVVAVDDFSDFLGRLQQSDRRAWETFDFCRGALGYDEERCQRLDLSVYDITEGRLGRFDVVFFFGTLYHLRHPLLALDRLSAICNQEIYVESAILDDFSPYRGGLGHGYPDGHMVAEFYPDNQYGDNATNWWVPTLHCLAHMIRAAGFPTVRAWKLTDGPPTHLAVCRGFAKGSKSA